MTPKIEKYNIIFILSSYIGCWLDDGCTGSVDVLRPKLRGDSGPTAGELRGGIVHIADCRHVDALHRLPGLLRCISRVAVHAAVVLQLLACGYRCSTYRGGLAIRQLAKVAAHGQGERIVHSQSELIY